MPDESPPACPAPPSDAFGPRALRRAPAEQHLVEACLEQVLAAHPAWPWPLIEEMARRRAEEILATFAAAPPRAEPGVAPGGQAALRTEPPMESMR
ncbi:hypothetical protein [Belnapia rosea]|uniref:hypothetical protein n=1 Tax=Belnapia rosea TaxID=938405 RepID=UPI0015A1A540|nr:hypothetical protein [Belnapia rosea]